MIFCSDMIFLMLISILVKFEALKMDRSGLKAMQNLGPKSWPTLIFNKNHFSKIPFQNSPSDQSKSEFQKEETNSQKKLAICTRLVFEKLVTNSWTSYIFREALLWCRSIVQVFVTWKSLDQMANMCFWQWIRQDHLLRWHIIRQKDHCQVKQSNTIRTTHSPTQSSTLF